MPKRSRLQPKSFFLLRNELRFKQAPALILLDLNMPVMSGWELHEELRSRQISVPVVYMTAAQRARSEAESHGAQGYLAKPFDLTDVLDAIERVYGPPASN